tara:strand:- start:6156 stop:6806 length:651 start_codon:yes stop_codon:yes gene_type:complete
METSKELKKGFAFLDQRTKSQRNEFYKRTIAFETKVLETRLKNAEKGIHSYGWTKEQAIESAQTQLNWIGVKTLTWLKDAEVYYDSKLMQVAKKLEGFGFLKSTIMLDAYGIENMDALGMNFYIKAWDTEAGDYAGRVHARIIPVDGAVKCFHYRWICTLQGATKKIEETVVEVESGQTKKEQIVILSQAGKSTKEIQILIGGNISYIRNVIRLSK